MTKIPVNMPGFAPNLPISATKTQSSTNDSDFSKILENQKNTDAAKDDFSDRVQDESEDITNDRIKERSKQEEVAGTSTREVEKESNVKESGETGNDASKDEDDLYSDEQLQMILPMLQTAATDVKDMLAELLNMDQTQLEALMEEMGISDVELLDMDALKTLVLQAGGAEDMTALLTDENLYSTMVSLEEGLGDIMENVQETLGLADDEMNVLKEQLTRMNTSESPVITVESTVEVNPGEQKQEAASEQGDGTGSGAFGMNGQNPFTVEAPVGETATFSTQSSGFVSEGTQEIMNQILDYMKIQLNADADYLEMQLQPESLGTLQIRITAKEGIMTAQFTTASESVRAALESQMVQLQQQLENQNIKVEAIEVMVQSHAFESALQQGEENQQQPEEKRNRTRAIDLNSLTEADELSEEDKMIAQMMEANGSTVDYLA